MADLSAILKDPNYVNANDATKRAIFDKYSAQDTNFTQANAATQAAIRQKFGVAEMAPAEIPAARQPGAWERARPYVAPALEMAGGLAGGAVGASAGLMGGGPVGAAYGGVAGSALGYAGAKELTELADVYLGGKAPRAGAQLVTEPVSNVMTGAAYEMGGQVAMPLLARAGGAIADVSQLGKQKAAKLAREALGGDLSLAINSLAKAKPGTTAAQATADINSPVWQAMLQRSLARDPKFLAEVAESQGEISLNALAKIAGGDTATAARTASKEAKNQLNKQLMPALRTELEAANTAGELLPGLQQKAGQFADVATQKVQDVRRFTAAGERAAARAMETSPVAGLPRVPGRYTYMGELAEAAEQQAAKAAEGSLVFGDAGRFAQSAADSLAAYGLKPLEAAPVASKIKSLAANPKYAGNRDVQRSLMQVSKDIAAWTKEGGVVDAWALDAIRKNSVNATIAKLNPGMNPTQQKELASSVMSKIKPVIIDAIDEAGGTGYRQYLSDYAAGMSEIAEQKLGAKALELWRTNKDAFIRLVEGNDPKTVEKILGKGKYDIAKDVSEQTLSTLQEQAKIAIRDASVARQATEGQDALREMWMEHMSKVRLPSYLNTVRTTADAALRNIEERLGKRTMNQLTQAAKSGKGMKDLLETLPATTRNQVLAIFNDPVTWRVPGAVLAVPAEETARNITGMPRNALAPANQNSLMEQ